jgi:hypothetical protein
MNDKVKLACGRQIVAIPLSQILPVKVITEQMRQTLKYSRIAASMREVGVIEPLVVYPQRSNGGQYILLDGHIRLEILRSMNQETADCLVADDDEAYTYNHKVSRLSAIQEHFMIMKAIKSGVSDERIAKSLHVDVGAIRRKVDVLEGICPEAVELLRTRNASAGTLRELKRVLPMRQIEMAELMVASRNFSTAYAKCLYAATPVEQLLESEKPKDVAGLLAYQ